MVSEIEMREIKQTLFWLQGEGARFLEYMRNWKDGQYNTTEPWVWVDDVYTMALLREARRRNLVGLEEFPTGKWSVKGGVYYVV